MSTVKRIIIVSSSFGGGFAVIFAIIVAGYLWYQSRPKPPIPWNTGAITANYDGVGTEGDENNFVFHYTLENHTDFDYKISKLSDAVCMAKLLRQNSLSGGPDNNFLTPDYPVLIPAKQRLFFRLHLKYSYEGKMKMGETKEEREKYQKELKKYVNKEFPNLNGFIIFDKVNRYQINFPNGWGDNS